METKIDMPADVFDAQFPQADSALCVREPAIVDLVRAMRLHGHAAQEMLGVQRRELIERMREAGIAPNERVLAEIRSDLSKVIAARGTPLPSTKRE